MSKLFSFVFSCVVIAGLSFNVALAQNETRRISLTPMVSDVLELPASAKNSLQQKLTQMALQNGMASQDGDFVLTASYYVVEDIIAPADVAQYVIKLDVMFYVVNLIEDLIMAENTCTVKGYGSSKDKAFLKAFNQINPHSAEAQQLISLAKENIITYYTERTNALMLKAKSLANQGQYGDALAVLGPIPDCVPGYNDILSLQDELFVKWIDSEADISISEAKKLIALADYENAYKLILSVNPLSTRFDDARKLSDEIDKRIQAAEKAEADAIQRQQETALAIAQAESAAKIKEKEAEIAQANANAEAAKAAQAKANADEAQANANAANAQAAISQTQLQALKQLKNKMSELSTEAQEARVDNAFKNQVQTTCVAQVVSAAKPAQTLQEKTESLKRFLLGKMYKA